MNFIAMAVGSFLDKFNQKEIEGCRTKSKPPDGEV